MASDIKELNKYMKIISLFVLLCNLLWWGWSLCRTIAETVRYSDQMFPYDHGRYYIEAFHSGLRSPLFCEAWSVSGGLIICGGEKRRGLVWLSAPDISQMRSRCGTLEPRHHQPCEDHETNCGDKIVISSDIGGWCRLVRHSSSWYRAYYNWLMRGWSPTWTSGQ